MAENPRIEELRRRVQADPASIAFAALAEEFRRVGRNEDAIETCRTGLQRHPAYLSARVTLGRALIETGEYEAAREELETVLRSAPENLAAIRGLATIHERLGHSTEMDPHLADMMKAMHAESIRAAAVTPPPAEPVAVPEPIVVEQATPEEAVLDIGTAPPFEPTAFQPEARFARFEAGPPFEPEAEPAPEQPQAQPAFEATPWREPAARTEPELDLSLSPPLGVAPAPDPDLAMMLQPEADSEAEAEPAMAAASGAGAEMLGTNPEMLATLARLERFLGAIQSLRA